MIAPWLLLTYVAIGLGEAVAWPAQQAIFVEVGRQVGMGSIMGLNQMGSSFGFLGGSLLGALVVSLFDLEAVFRYAGIAVMTGVLLFWLLMRRAQGQLRATEGTAHALALARE